MNVKPSEESLSSSISQQIEKMSEDLKDIKTQIQYLRLQERFIDLEGLCKILGIAKRTYYKNKKNYGFRSFKFGKGLRFDREEVISWLHETIQSEEV